MTPQYILTAALEQCGRDEANGVELFPAYNRLKAACEQAAEALALGAQAAASEKKLIVPESVPRVCSRRLLQPIIDCTARVSQVQAADLLGPIRTARLTAPRHVCMFLLRKFTPLTLNEIGRTIGGRDHSTAQHAIKKVAGGKYAELLTDVEAALFGDVAND